MARFRAFVAAAASAMFSASLNQATHSVADSAGHTHSLQSPSPGNNISSNCCSSPTTSATM